MSPVLVTSRCVRCAGCLTLADEDRRCLNCGWRDTSGPAREGFPMDPKRDAAAKSYQATRHLHEVHRAQCAQGGRMFRKARLLSEEEQAAVREDVRQGWLIVDLAEKYNTSRYYIVQALKEASP